MEVKLSENLVVPEVAKASNASQSTDSLLETDLAKSNSQQSVETVKEVSFAASLLEDIVETSGGTSLSFSVEQDVNRMVVAVRAVGSDEVLRQFPPEEFISVAKFIASQNPDVVDDDFLKGVLFDQRT
jgi:uncharacterized FlaG/YvyC family protein